MLSIPRPNRTLDPDELSIPLLDLDPECLTAIQPFKVKIYLNQEYLSLDMAWNSKSTSLVGFWVYYILPSRYEMCGTFPI